jgi:hypothetical protein
MNVRIHPNSRAPVRGWVTGRALPEVPCFEDLRASSTLGAVQFVQLPLDRPRKFFSIACACF